MNGLDKEQMADELTGRKIRVSYKMFPEQTPNVREFIVATVKDVGESKTHGTVLTFTDENHQHRVVPVADIHVVGRKR